jgi:hypothetical protein
MMLDYIGNTTEADAIEANETTRETIPSGGRNWLKV